jgi:hypothetical protein
MLIQFLYLCGVDYHISSAGQNIKAVITSQRHSDWSSSSTHSECSCENSVANINVASGLQIAASYISNSTNQASCGDIATNQVASNIGSC